MNKRQRVLNLLMGMFMMFMAFVLVCIPEDGYELIIAALSIGLVCGGIRSLYFYFTMARHMVGGKRLLYRGVIVLDFGLFTASLSYIPHFYILLYLLGIHMFSGAMDIWSALDAKKLGSDHWRLKLSRGVIDVVIGILCLVFIRQRDTAVYIYCAGLVYNGIMRVLASLRRTAMVYIP